MPNANRIRPSPERDARGHQGVGAATLGRWLAWREEDRQVWLDALLERLPSWLVLVDPVGSLPIFEDARHGQRFALLLEADVLVGLSPERVESVNAALARDWLQLFSPEVHLPAREVRVAAHLSGLTPMSFEGHEWIHRDSRPRLTGLLAERGWRLPSEAEWEVAWRVARPLAPFQFGEVELCADDWHVGYDGAPLDGRPWGSGAEVVRQWDRGGQSVDAVLPARRPIRSTSITQVRPAITLDSP